MILNNETTYVNTTNGVSATDKTDVYNGTSLYELSKRNLKKAQTYIEQNFTEQTTFKDVRQMLEQYNIKYRVYCSID